MTRRRLRLIPGRLTLSRLMTERLVPAGLTVARSPAEELTAKRLTVWIPTLNRLTTHARRRARSRPTTRLRRRLTARTRRRLTSPARRTLTAPARERLPTPTWAKGGRLNPLTRLTPSRAEGDSPTLLSPVQERLTQASPIATPASPIAASRTRSSNVPASVTPASRTRASLAAASLIPVSLGLIRLTPGSLTPTGLHRRRPTVGNLSAPDLSRGPTPHSPTAASRIQPHHTSTSRLRTASQPASLGSPHQLARTCRTPHNRKASPPTRARPRPPARSHR